MTSTTNKDLTEQLRGEFYSSTYRKVFTQTQKPLYYRKKVCNIVFSIQEGAQFKRKATRYEVSFNGSMNQTYSITDHKQVSNSESGSSSPNNSTWIPKFGQQLIRFQNILNLEHGAQIKILFFANDQQQQEQQLGRVLIDLYDKSVFPDTSKSDARLVLDVLDYENKSVGKISTFVQVENLFQKK